MAASVPTDLRTISPFIQRANELKAHEPALAYWCSYHALQLAVALKPTASASRAFMFKLMDELEEAKKQAGDDPLFHDEASAVMYIRTFATKIFYGADNEDRSGRATKETAKTFLVAANFFELLTIFNQTSSDDTSKSKYAKWKASSISKALREGRIPAPGPPGWEPPPPALISEDVEPDPVVSADEEASLRAELAGLGFEDPAAAANSHRHQQQRPEQIQEEEDAEDAEIAEILRPKPRPQSWSSPTPPVLELRPSSPFYSPKFDSAFETAQSLFLGKEKDGNGGGGKPSAPPLEGVNGVNGSGNDKPLPVPSAPVLPQVAITPPAHSQTLFSHPSSPSTSNPRSTFSSPVTASSPLRTFTPPFQPSSAASPQVGPPYHSSNTSSFPSSTTRSPRPSYQTHQVTHSLPTRAPALPPKVFAPTPVAPRSVAPPVSSVPAQYTEQQHQQYTNTVLHAPPAVVQEVNEMTHQEIAKVQKHAKWAISALDYEDFETARKELRNALRMLGG